MQRGAAAHQRTDGFDLGGVPGAGHHEEPVRRCRSPRVGSRLNRCDQVLADQVVLAREEMQEPIAVVDQQ